MSNFFTFKRENNDFQDILCDETIKKNITTKIQCAKHLIIGLKDCSDDSIVSYINLKYGNDMTTLSKDYTPKPYVDYTPKKRFPGR